MLILLGSQIGQFMERKDLEQQFRHAQKLEEIGTMAAGIAHNFGNLMTAVVGHSELALSKLEKNSAVSGDLAEIKRAGERAAALTRQLLAFSRKQVMVSQLLDLNRIVDSMERLLRPIISSGIELLIAPDPALGLVRTDPVQIEQVILNLVVNARDAMPQGGRLTLTTKNVRLESHDEELGEIVAPGAYVALEVSDTGTGMDPETRKRIFEPFFTTKEPGKGSGLGLSTVYGIIKQTGGYVTLSTRPEEGTTFKIYLPLAAERGD
jgi:signal transduction histidine kinase